MATMKVTSDAQKCLARMSSKARGKTYLTIAKAFSKCLNLKFKRAAKRR